MKKPPFGDEAIIRFLFDEMDRAESEAFLSALCADEALWQRYEYFQEVVEQLGTLQEAPSDYAVEQIMAYVRRPAPPAQPPAWFPFALNLNALVVAAMVVFFSVAVLGFAYKLRRGDIAQPADKLVQQVQPAPVNSLYDWDDSDIREKLDRVRDGIEVITDAPVL